jgi:hypothetical protein
MGSLMDIGNQGQAACVASLPFKFLEPCGGFVWFILHSIRLRKQVADKYNFEYATPCCCNIEVPMLCAGKLKYINLLLLKY